MNPDESPDDCSLNSLWLFEFFVNIGSSDNGLLSDQLWSLSPEPIVILLASVSLRTNSDEILIKMQNLLSWKGILRYLQSGSHFV